MWLVQWCLWLAVLLMGIAAPAGATAEDMPELPHVLQLSSSNFSEHIIDTDGLAVVEFFTPTCSACIAFAPEFAKVAKSLQGIATAAAVDCSAPAAQRLCETYHVARLPTVKLFEPERKVNPYTGGHMKDQQEFSGMPTARDLSKAATALLHDRHITRLTSQAEADTFLAKEPSLAKVLLFTDKRAATTLYKGLSCKFRGRLSFGEVHKDVQELVAKYSVETFPTLLVVQNDSSVERYEGELKGLPLSDYLSTFAAAEAAPADSGHPGDASTGPAAGMAGDAAFRALDLLPELSLAELSELDEREEMRLLAFYASEDAACAQQLEELAKFLGDLQGLVPLGRFNTSGVDRAQLARYGLDWERMGQDGCSAQLVLLPFGEDKQEQDEYARWDGGLTSAKELQQWVFARMPDPTLQITSPEALQMFMAAGSAAPSGAKIGQVVLLSSKQEVPAVFKALAVGMVGRARWSFGWIAPGSAFAEKAKSDFKASKVPHIVSIVPYSGKDAPQSAKGGQALALQAYTGPMKYPYMMMWLMQLAHTVGLAEGGAAVAEGGGDDVPADAGSVPLVSSLADFERHCTSQGGICVLGLLDAGAPAFADHVATLNGAAAQHVGQPLHFVQVDAARQPSLLSSLGVGNHQLPTAAALSAKRLRFALSQPPFSAGRIAALLKDVLSGRAATTPLQELPRIVEGGEAGAGGGAGDGVTEQEALEEPEFDLADIMAEEVEQRLASKEEQLQQVEAELHAAEAQRAAEAAAAAASEKSAKKRKKKKRTSKNKANQKDEL